ncbi:hypothetical protein [Caballeronia sp. M23-90]
MKIYLAACGLSLLAATLSGCGGSSSDSGGTPPAVTAGATD